MTPVGFECVHCHNRLAVAAEWAGKAVRCPRCQVVVVAPAAGPPVPPPPPGSGPDFSRFAPSVAAETDSIFSDPDDGDADSVFGGVSESRRPILPPSADATQPTLRVPGVPAPTPTAGVPAGAMTAVNRFPDRPAVTVTPADVSNPFRRMVDEVMTAAMAGDAADDEPDLEPDPATPARPARWLKWALVGVSVYAALATAAAVWGWTRTPADKPALPAPRK